jgi:hypothetical protein
VCVCVCENKNTPVMVAACLHRAASILKAGSSTGASDVGGAADILRAMPPVASGLLRCKKNIKKSATVNPQNSNSTVYVV